MRGIKRWFLATADAYGLYRRYGFEELRDVPRFMAIESTRDARDCADG